MSISMSGQDYTGFGRQEVEVELPLWLERLNDFVGKHYQKQFPTLGFHDFTVQQGRKYARIIRHGSADGLQRSAFCFVRLSDGAILKAASWKAPALNYARGYIFDQDVSLSVTPYGTR
jgi:hypothetical protein